jgi:hypothetical protein
VNLLAPRCPVDDRERSWIEDSMAWFRGQFGDGPLSQPVVLPTHEYFPPPSSGGDAHVAAVVRQVSGYMGLPPDQVSVRFTDHYDHAAALTGLIPGASSNISGAAGTYQAGKAGPVITIDRSVIRDPAQLLAVIAHELGHVRLLGEGRIAADREDGEPLTDLVTVYLGMGILTANAAFDFTHRPDQLRRIGGWSARHLGYLTEQMFGYGLAAYAVMRGEPDPTWQKYLDTNPRVYCRHGLRYLKHSGWNGASGQAG